MINAWVQSSAETKVIGMWIAGEYLEKIGIYKSNEILLYSGASSGAITSLLLCLGFSYGELMSWIRENWKKLRAFKRTSSFFTFLDYKINSIFSLEPLEKILTDLITTRYDRVMTLEELYELTGKELIISTYNFTDNKTEYLSHRTYPNLSVLTAVIMSSSIPGIFPRCIVMGKEYVDGCYGDSFPMHYVSELNYTPFGICASYKPSRVTFISRLFTMNFHQSTNQYHKLIITHFPYSVLEIKLRSNLNMNNFYDFICECEQDVDSQIHNELIRLGLK